MTRCRVSEDELAHDHEQVEITPEMEREEARDKFGALMLQSAQMAELLFQDWRYHPDADEMEALEHLHEQLSYYRKVEK